MRDLSEEDIKLRYITPAIDCKWDRNNQIRMEYFFTDGRVIVRGNSNSRGNRKKADYVLFYKRNLPLAVVEAKDNNHAVGAGMQQSIEYAEILDIPFAYSSNGDAFVEHDLINGTERDVALADFPTPEELWERYTRSKNFSTEQEQMIVEPYHYQVGEKTPRYYQRIAINRTIEAVSCGTNRILLVMATGTGKTFTAFQIIYRLIKSGKKRKILYLADRNFLIDHTMQQDFKPFDKIMTKITGKTLDSSYEVYMSLYHQLAGNENEEPFRVFKPSFFDLIIVDECHRGSARGDSLWRKILDYFSEATHIGMTATPKETKVASNIDYFGEPLYTYSLKQGIDDGFLAPYKVVRINIDKDQDGWRPPVGKVDIYGNEIEDREYNIKDFDRKLVLDHRTKTVAKRISDFLRETNRFDKTIVFCVDIEHAARMRQALVNENSDLCSENSKYVMQITGDNEIGKAQLEYFVAEDEKYPVIVTTSKLMTTGLDAKTCKLIVLDNNINSMTEFKQIIGRGTRLKPEYFVDGVCYSKNFFTIMDFRNASRLFADPDFDGDPESIINNGGSDDENEAEDDGCVYPSPDDSQDDDHVGERVRKYYVNDVKVEIINEMVQYYDREGRLTTESITDYSKRNILGEYSTLDNFLNAWNTSIRKQAIINELQERGVLLDALREVAGNRDIDDFDLICHIAFDKKPLTKAERAANVRKRDYLSRFEGVAREVLSALLDKYASTGIMEPDKVEVLRIDPFRKIAPPKIIITAFGGKAAFIQAVRELQNQIYMVAS